MRIKICVFLVCGMVCFSGYAFASGKSTGMVQKKMPLVYLQVLQSDLDPGAKAFVLLAVFPAFERYRAMPDVEHMDWPWEDDDDEDDEDDDEDDDDDGGNEYVCIFDAVSAMILNVKNCDSDFTCIFLNVFKMVLEIASCTE